MELLDRYLQVVKKHLPWGRQEDIIAELKANLESQLEDKEAELGRPLTKVEAEAWLKQMGLPIQVAARYLPQRYLIGPAVFPMYWYVLKLACFWSLIIFTIVSAVQTFAGTTASDIEFLGVAIRIPGISMTTFLEILLRMPEVLITVAAWVTLIFAAIEFGITHNPPICGPLAGAISDWSPATLPPVDRNAKKKPHSFAQAAAEVIFGFLFLVWLLLIPANPWLLMGPGALAFHASPFRLAPVWIQIYWCVLGLNVLQLAWNCVDLARESWQRPQPAKQIAAKALGLIPLLVLLAAPENVYLTLRNPAFDQGLHGAQLAAINHGIFMGAVVISTIVSLQLLWEIGRLSLNAYRRRASAR
jgi:hypothetical protein